MLHLLQMGLSNVLITFPLQIQSSWQLSLLELPPPYRVSTCSIVTPSSNSSDMYTSTVQSGPHLPMLHSRPTLIFKPLIFNLPILYLLSLPPHHRPLPLAAFLRLHPFLPPDSLRALQWNAKGLEPEALNYFTSFRRIPLTLSVSRNPPLTLLPLSGFSALRSDRTHSQSGILSRDATHASGSVIIFVRQGLSFSKLSTSSFFA